MYLCPVMLHCAIWFSFIGLEFTLCLIIVFINSILLICIVYFVNLSHIFFYLVLDLVNFWKFNFYLTLDLLHTEHTVSAQSYWNMHSTSGDGCMAIAKTSPAVQKFSICHTWEVYKKNVCELGCRWIRYVTGGPAICSSMFHFEIFKKRQM